MLNELNTIDKILLEFNQENYNNQDINNIINYILLENNDISTLITEIPQIINSKKIFDGQFNYSFEPILNESNMILVELVQPIIHEFIPQHIYGSFTNLHAKSIISQILNINIQNSKNIYDIKNKIIDEFVLGNIKIPINSLRKEPILDNIVTYGIFAPFLFKLINLDNITNAKIINDLLKPIDKNPYKINIVSKILQLKKDFTC